MLATCGTAGSSNKGAALFTETLCNNGNAYNGDRKTACEGSLSVDTVNSCSVEIADTCGAQGTVTKRDALFTETLCTRGTAYHGSREVACAASAAGAARADDTQCAGTLTRVCVTEAKIYNSVCLRPTTGAQYQVARGTACAAINPNDSSTGTRDALCGNEAGVGGTYIQAYCAAGGAALNNHRDCRSAYEGDRTAPSQVTVSNVLGATGAKALNGEGTAQVTGNNGFIASGAAAKTANRADFFTDVTRDPSNTELDIPSIPEDGSNNSESTGYLTLNLFDPANNDKLSGFAFARSEYATKLEDNRYVGLLAGTNLGAPLAAGFTATWKAKILLIVNRSNAIEETFTMAVDFNARSIKNSAAVDVTGFGMVLIDGKFTANGLIYGTVDVNNTTENLGTLTGLIGEKGAVGIFKSSNTTQNPYVGGFIAAPLSDVTALGFRGKAMTGLTGTDVLTVLDAATPSSVIGSVNFIEGNANVFDASQAAIIYADTLSLTTSGSTQGGVAFSFGDATNGTANYHVGILANTNVGPALSGAVGGDWTGSIQGILDGALSSSATIKFAVDYTSLSFTVSEAPNLDAGFGTITVDGNFLANGVVYGTVDFTGANTGQGTLTGLIGQDALVGGFAGAASGDDKPYVGGFIATNPNTAPPVDEEEADCTDSAGATPFDASCDESNDAELQVRLCTAELSKRSVRLTNFNIHCVTNDRVTSLVCTGSGEQLNPFHPTLCSTIDSETLTEKKNLSQTHAQVLVAQIL